MNGQQRLKGQVPPVSPRTFDARVPSDPGEHFCHRVAVEVLRGAHASSEVWTNSQRFLEPTTIQSPPPTITLQLLWASCRTRRASEPPSQTPQPIRNPRPRPPNLILPSLLTSITSGLCFWEQEERRSQPARHGDSVAMALGLKKKKNTEYCPEGSDKGSTVLLQRGWG